MWLHTYIHGAVIMTWFRNSALLSKDKNTYIIDKIYWCSLHIASLMVFMHTHIDIHTQTQ